MGMRVGLSKKREKLLNLELKRIVSELKKLGVLKIILFGSLNDKTVGRNSDIDITIIRNTKKSFSQRLEDVYAKVNPRVAVDFFIYTPNEIKTLRNTNVFIHTMLEKGKILYEA
ncbi:MAG: nucleotidyltransferase domain-containing protein [Candidatus Micrarchaeota archaeon]|nr:nucleotidyltransferase domain-containing protein [Candidatus Micrarchaeota archaeon]